MTLQLTVFTLLVLVLLLFGALSRIDFTRDGYEGGLRDAGLLLEVTLRDTMWTYLAFAPLSLWFYFSGKPDLLPQYLAWVVVGLEILRALAAVIHRLGWARFFRLVNVCILIFLWVAQLPVFQSAPQ